MEKTATENNCCNTKNTPLYFSGCMVCGADIVYNKIEITQACYYCEQTFSSYAQCFNGHFVCDKCHTENATEVIKNICLTSDETDAARLMQTIRSHKVFPIHGPEHHSLVPAVILTVLRNTGKNIREEQILTAIQRGQNISGGACAFWGTCGAAIGVGIAISILLEATPYEGEKRQAAQQATTKVLGEIAAYNAPRCCQRDSWTALKVASKVLRENMKKTLCVADIKCQQYEHNHECIYEKCPLWMS